jgi:3D (Asp-Asp-Asp) domain-containing protein
MKSAFLFSLCLAGLLSCISAARADDTAKAVPEYAMKAVYLYNFAQLTEWPATLATGRESFNLCVIGPDEIVAALEPLRGRRVNQQHLRLLRITESSEARQCQMLFVAEDIGTQGIRLLDTLRGTTVLTITDDPRVARAGAMLTIQAEGKRLAFNVNLDIARMGQLRFSSKLLHLASRVVGE